MIYEVAGDILLTEAQAIAHGVAPHDHFDSGLALQLRKNYPAMVKDFRHFCKIYNPAPGEIWMWGTVDKRRIFNLLTQEAAPTPGGHPGAATLPYVNRCLRLLARKVEEEQIASLALPRLATGVGGLDWNDVRPLIVDRLGKLDIPVYIYATYVKGRAVTETALLEA